VTAVDTLEIVLIAAAALVAIAFATRAASKGRRSGQAEEEPRASGAAAPSAGAVQAGAAAAELVAVIAAAVAAESGMAPESFRVAGISAVGAQGSVGGFNTPPWGFVDRLSRAART
jgi:hypothetical protein